MIEKKCDCENNNENPHHYFLEEKIQGVDFLEKFHFREKLNDVVQYVDEKTALKHRLCEFPDKHGLRLSVSDFLINGVRQSVQIESKGTHNGGLFILDIAHMPFGQSVWPAFWLSSKDWRTRGEIDIIEYVNSYDFETSKNYSTLHIDKPCIQNIPEIVNGKTCDQGCSVCAGKNSAGYGFNEAHHGGIYACEWVYDGPIKMWFIPRKKVNQYIPCNAMYINTCKWPDPYVVFKPCKGFRDQRVIIDINLCGNYAGNDFPGGIDKCNQYVKDPENKFSDAYWLINYLKIFKS